MSGEHLEKEVSKRQTQNRRFFFEILYIFLKLGPFFLLHKKTLKIINLLSFHLLYKPIDKITRCYFTLRE